jgi:hypothetical protein
MFAHRIEIAVHSAQTAAAPYMTSKAEICDAIQPIITELQQMPREEAVAYIRQSYSHIGYQALAVRMFKGQPV